MHKILSEFEELRFLERVLFKVSSAKLRTYKGRPHLTVAGNQSLNTMYLSKLKTKLFNLP